MNVPPLRQRSMAVQEKSADICDSIYIGSMPLIIYLQWWFLILLSGFNSCSCSWSILNTNMVCTRNTARIWMVLSSNMIVFGVRFHSWRVITSIFLVKRQDEEKDWLAALWIYGAWTGVLAMASFYYYYCMILPLPIILFVGPIEIVGFGGLSEIIPPIKSEKYIKTSCFTCELLWCKTQLFCRDFSFLLFEFLIVAMHCINLEGNWLC